MVAPGMGCVQHLGGILDSSFVAWLIMIRRQSPQYVWPHGRFWSSFSFCLLKSSRQHIHELKNHHCQYTGQFGHAHAAPLAEYYPKFRENLYIHHRGLWH